MKIALFKSFKLPLIIDKISSDFHWLIILIFDILLFYYNDSFNSLLYTQIEFKEEIV